MAAIMRELFASSYYEVNDHNFSSRIRISKWCSESIIPEELGAVQAILGEGVAESWIVASQLRPRRKVRNSKLLIAASQARVINNVARAGIIEGDMLVRLVNEWSGLVAEKKMDISEVIIINAISEQSGPPVQVEVIHAK